MRGGPEGGQERDKKGIGVSRYIAVEVAVGSTDSTE